MNRAVSTGPFVALGIPILLIGVIVFISKSAIFHVHPGPVSIGITIDLLLTIPLTYYLLIRRTALPKISVVPLFVMGLTIATVILPAENQALLDFVKAWMLPALEGVLIVWVVKKVREAIKANQQNRDATTDFFTVIKNICADLLPGSLAKVFASEVAVIYYGFVQWRKGTTATNEFTYHKESGIAGVLAAIIFLVIVEASILHLLLAKWNVWVAWILTGLSVYTAIQLMGVVKSITLRPILVLEDKLLLRYGILSEAVVAMENIESVSVTRTSIEVDDLTKTLSLFGKIEGHNIVIRVKRKSRISGLYGIDREFTTLALHVDEKDEFKRLIDERIVDAVRPIPQGISNDRS